MKWLTRWFQKPDPVEKLLQAVKLTPDACYLICLDKMGLSRSASNRLAEVIQHVTGHWPIIVRGSGDPRTWIMLYEIKRDVVEEMKDAG